MSSRLIPSDLFYLLVPLLLVLAGVFPAAGDEDPLAATFASPPSTAAPQTWWHWVNGNITKDGITADLEAMKRVGIGGATIVNISYLPPGPVEFMSDSWRQMVQHAVHESARLGLQLGVENCAGWSSSGGPWVTPEYGMQKVVFTETEIKGDVAFSGMLPQPETRLGLYHDIAVLAFPTPAARKIHMDDFSPKITASDPLFDASKLNQPQGMPSLPPPSRQHPQYIQFEFAKPFLVRSLSLFLTAVYDGEIQASDDGQSFRTLRHFRFDSPPAAAIPGENTYEIPVTSSRFFRILFEDTHQPVMPQFSILRARLSPAAVVDDFRGKADYLRRNGFADASSEELPPGLAIDPSQILNLTVHLNPAGRLDWQPPAGDWTVLRIGYTPTGTLNHPAAYGGEGLECDKLSRAALKFHWDHMMAKVIADSGPLAGKTLNQTLVDSYEVGSQNWTAGLEKEFLKRQGYDLTNYLPLLAGWVVGSPEQSDRVLWDFRRTIADMFAENYYDYMGDLARQSGLQLCSEPYGDGPFDNLRSGGGADIPMTEFWNKGPLSRDLKGGPMISHVYGHAMAGAESFTGAPENSKWQQYPALLKPLGDFAFTCGINHMFFHRFAHQPWLDRAPGMTAGPWGTDLDRTNTWWEQGKAWIHYLTRCQYLLQQGRFVADVLVLGPEGSPSDFPQADVPTGHDWDGCNDDILFHRMSVKDGRIVLADGMNYRVLVLNSGTKMTPELLQKLKSLAESGATIIGRAPVKSPSFRNYPQCDTRVKTLADDLWKSGKIRDLPLQDVFTAMNLPPDFECRNAAASFQYIHRTTTNHEIYFVSNQHHSNQESDCLFRVEGEIPELYYPDTGKVMAVPYSAAENGCTQVHLRLDPVGSVFVVFHSAAPVVHPLAWTETGVQPAAEDENHLQITQAIFESKEDPQASRDVTANLAALVNKEGVLTTTVDDASMGGDPASFQKKQLRVDYVLNGKNSTVTVPEGLDLRIPPADDHAEFPSALVTCRPDGAWLLQAWQAGTYQIKSSAGSMQNVSVPTMPSRLKVEGPWQITFLKKSGAPLQTTFDHLLSWSESTDKEVEYFSGTASYTKTFDVPATLTGPGHRLYLDLGNVQVIAELKVNGKDMGILWKPPFGVDVTSAVQTGMNSLEVKVTNLWINRLIGDEQLPPDCEWDAHDGGIKQWPQWLLDDKPSPTGRVTFASWHFWEKNDPLKESGLLGPVVLVPSIVQAIR